MSSFARHEPFIGLLVQQYCVLRLLVLLLSSASVLTGPTSAVNEIDTGVGYGITNDHYSEGDFREYFFTTDNLIDFGKLINYIMFRNYVTTVTVDRSIS